MIDTVLSLNFPIASEQEIAIQLELIEESCIVEICPIMIKGQETPPLV
jgi:hypothetical protein